MGVVKRQSIQTTVLTYMGAALGYLNLVLIFPKFLSPEQVGLTRVIISTAAILSQFSLFGVSYAVLRFFPYFNDRSKGHNGLLTFAITVASIGFFFFSLLAILFHQPIEDAFRKNSFLFVQHYYYIFPIAFTFVFFEILFFYSRSFYKTVVPVFIKEVLLRLLQLLAVILYILKWINFEGFIFFFAGSYMVQLLAMIVYIAYLKQLFIFSKIDFAGHASLRQLIRYSAFIFGTSIASIYVANIDVILLSSLINLRSTAVYSISFFVGTIIQIPGKAMNQVAITVVADAWKQNDMKKLQAIYQQTSLTQLIIGGFIFLIVWINVDLLLSLLPPDYAAAKWVIFVVAMGKLFDLGMGINSEIILMSKHVKINLATNLFLMIVSTVANYLLIPVLGIMGSAVASAISLFTYNMIRFVFLERRYRLQPLNINTVKALILLLAAFGLFYLLPDTSNLWINGIYQSAAVGIFFLSCLIWLGISPEINETYYSLLKKYFPGA